MNPSTFTPQKGTGAGNSSTTVTGTGPSASLVNAHQFALAQLHQAAQLRTSPPHHPIHPSAWDGETVDEGHFASIIHEQSVLISKLLHEKKIIAEENTRNRRAMRGIDERVESIMNALGLKGKASSSDDAAGIEAESAAVDPLTFPSLTPHVIDSAHMVQLTEDNVRLIQEMQSLTAILGYFYGQTEEAISMAGEALTHANEATGEEEELTVGPVLNQTLSDIQQLLSQLSISLLHANDPDAVAASAQASADGRSLASFQPFASSVALNVPIQAVIQHYKQLQSVKDIMALNQTQSGDNNQSFSLATTAPLPSLTTSSSSSQTSGPLSPSRNMSAAARQVPLGVSAGLLGPQSVSADESTLALQNQIQALQNQLLKLANENQELKSLASSSLKSRRQSRGSDPGSSDDDDESFTDAVSKFFAPLAGGSNRGGQVKSNQSTPAHSRVTTRDNDGFMEQRSPIRPLQLQPNSFVLPSSVVGGGMNPQKAEEFVKTNVEIWNQKETAYIEQEKKLLERIEQLKSEYRNEIESLKAKSATPAPVTIVEPISADASESSLAITLASLQAAHASLSQLQASTESRRLAANERAHTLAAEKAHLVQERNQTIDQLTRENERLQTMYETLETESRNNYYTLQKAYRELEAKYNMLASSVEKEREKLAKKKLNETKEKENARRAALLKFRADTTAAPSASFFRSLNASGLNSGISSATATPPLSSPNSANAIQRQRSLQKAFAAAQKRQDSMMGRMRSRSSERVEPTTPSGDEVKGTAFGGGNRADDGESDNEFSGSQSVPQTSPSSPRWAKKDHHSSSQDEEEKQQVAQSSPGGTELSQEEYEHQVRLMAEQQYQSELAHFQAVETANAMEEAKMSEEYLRAEQMHQHNLHLIEQQKQQIQAQQFHLQQQQEQFQLQQQQAANQQQVQQPFEQFATSSPEQQQAPHSVTDESHATPSFTAGVAFNSSFLSEKTNASPATNTASLKITTTPGRKNAPLPSPSASNGLRQQLLVPFNSSIVGSPSSYSHSSTGSHTTGLSSSPPSSSSLVPTTKRLVSTTSSVSGGAPGLARKKTAATSALTAALNRAISTAGGVSGESASASPPAPLTRLKSQTFAGAAPTLTKDDRNAKSSYLITGSFLSQPLNPSFHEEYALPASYIKMHGSHSTSALAHMHQGKYVMVDATKRTGYLHHKSDLPVAVAQRNQTLVGMSVKTDAQSPLVGGQQQMLLTSSPTVAYESGGHGSGPQSSGALVAGGSPLPDGSPSLQRAASSLNTQTTVPLHHALFPDARTRPLIRQNTVLAAHQKQANSNEKWFVLGGSHGADGFRALPPKIDARWDVNASAAQQHMPEQQLLESLQQHAQTLQVTDLPIGASAATSTALTTITTTVATSSLSSPHASPLKSPSSAPRPTSSPASKSNKKKQQKRPESASASPPAVGSSSKPGRPGLSMNASRKADTAVHEFSQWDDEEENHHVGLISVKAE